MTLLDYPVYLINVDSRPDRLEYATNNIKNAGFNNITRIRATEPDNLIDNEIEGISSLREEGRLASCCTNSHLNVWKRIIQDGHERAVVCEDDLYFIDKWHSLWEEYYKSTPSDYDFIYVGGTKKYDTSDKILINTLTFCMHCYVITKDFIDYFFSKPHYNIPILDVYLFNIIKRNEHNRKFILWNVPDNINTNININDRFKHMSRTQKHGGLALQNEEFLTTLSSIPEFVRACNITEGYTTQVPEYMVKIEEILKSLHIENILEIGFNAGCSSDSFLSMFRKCLVTSIDLCEYNYVSGAKKIIDHIYQYRHNLIIGDSTNVVPLLDSSKKFDFIFIDGGHFGDVPKLDLHNCKRLAHKDTIVVMDDTYNNEINKVGWNISPTRAWKEGIASGLINELGYIDFSVGRGFSWGKYCI